jgi:outer membrane protein TolC
MTKFRTKMISDIKNLMLAACAACVLTFGAKAQTPTATPSASPSVIAVPPPSPSDAVTPAADAPAPKNVPSSERVGVNNDDQTPLTLEDAIRLALENNNDIEIARSDVKTSELDLTAARGAYVPEVYSESYFRRSTTPVASSLGGGADGTLTETSLSTNFGLRGKVPFQGGTFSSNYSSSRTTTNNLFSSINPQYPSAFSVQYEQPLLRGRSFDNERRQIEVAKKNLALTDSQFRQRIIDVIAQIEIAYWDLVYAQRNLQVQLDGLKLANAQVESNERQVAEGVLAPSDVLEAKTQVAAVRQNVHLAQQAVTEAENNLKNLILPDRKSPMWSNPIVPVTPTALEAPKTDLESSLVTALANRPEIQQLDVAAEINEIDQRYFRDQKKPQIDLVGAYSSNGLAGTLSQSTGANPLISGLNPLISRVNELSALNDLPPVEFPTGTGSSIPENLNGGFGRSLSNLLGQKYPTYQVGVRISLPLKNKVAEANLGKTLVQENRIQSQREKTELLIETEVRNALQAVRSQEERLKAAVDARKSAEQLYESEQRKFQSGTSTTFLVLQRQTELITARGREVQAQTDLNKAITRYERAVGTTMETAGVSLNEQTPALNRPVSAEITTVFGKKAVD